MLIRRRPQARARRGALLAAPVLVAPILAGLAACSSGADPSDLNATQTPFSASSSVTTATSNPSANTSPSPGAVVSSDGRFNVVVPTGWNLSRQPKTVVYLSSATVAHDVAPTIVVTRSSVTPAPALDDTLTMATMQARQAGGTVGASPDRTIGGEKAVSFTATSKEKNIALKRTYVMVAHDKALYSIVLTGAEADASRDEAVLNSLLASWTWTKAGVPGSTANGTTPAAVPTSTSTPPSPSSSVSSSGASGAAPSSPTSSPSSTSAHATPHASASHSSGNALTPQPSSAKAATSK